jgi:homoaconitase/3-isopropylmalate dehydratase large subunit
MDLREAASIVVSRVLDEGIKHVIVPNFRHPSDEEEEKGIDNGST